MIEINENSIKYCNDKILIPILISKKTKSTNLDAFNSELLEAVFISETQTEGKGQYNRKWISPAGNIYLSYKKTLKISHQHLLTLSLVIGTCIIKTLQNITENFTDFKLKWPNDIYYKNKKITGILIETKISKDNFTTFIIGIGININSKIQDYSSMPNATSLFVENNMKYDRNIIISKILSEILMIFKKNQLDFSFHLGFFNNNYLLKNKSVSLTIENKKILGTAVELEKDGFFRIKQKDKILKFHSGSIDF